MLLRFILFILSGLMFQASKCAAQETNVSKDFDTSNLVIRVCKGDMPGQESDPSKDYFPFICCYTYTNYQLITYEVLSFDMILILENGEKDIAHSKGNRLSKKSMIY